MSTPQELATQLHSLADQVGSLDAGASSAAAASADQAAGSADQAAGSADQAAGSADQAAGSADQAPASGTPAQAPASPIPGTDAVVVQADEHGEPQTLASIAADIGADEDELKALNAGQLGAAAAAPPAGTVLAVPQAATAADQSAGADQASADQTAAPQDVVPPSAGADTTPSGEPAAGVVTTEAPTDGNA